MKSDNLTCKLGVRQRPSHSKIINCWLAATANVSKKSCRDRGKIDSGGQRDRKDRAGWKLSPAGQLQDLDIIISKSGANLQFSPKIWSPLPADLPWNLDIVLSRSVPRPGCRHQQLLLWSWTSSSAGHPQYLHVITNRSTLKPGHRPSNQSIGWNHLSRSLSSVLRNRNYRFWSVA